MDKMKLEQVFKIIYFYFSNSHITISCFPVQFEFQDNTVIVINTFSKIYASRLHVYVCVGFNYYIFTSQWNV